MLLFLLFVVGLRFCLEPGNEFELATTTITVLFPALLRLLKL
jgi:hypothetical protein